MNLQPHNPPHPGGLTGKAGVSPEMAVRLSKVLGGSAESWLTLQESYDLWKARQSVDTTSLERLDFNEVA